MDPSAGSDPNARSLHDRDPSSAADVDESPEGHALRFDSAGGLVGVTLVNARRLLEQGAPIESTVPQRPAIDPAALAPAIDSAA
jgi:hypothetical protein